jgi:hypothetical protein
LLASNRATILIEGSWDKSNILSWFRELSEKAVGLPCGRIVQFQKAGYFDDLKITENAL